MKVQAISKRYGAFNALRNISFEIHQNGVIGLLGENGAGKTTLLNILCGALPATHGEVAIEGCTLTESPLQYKRKIGYAPDVPPLYPEMTVREFLAFIIQLRQVLPNEQERHLKDVAALTNVTDVLPVKIQQLSHGYRQRVSVAQALCGQPRVLCFDEPTNGLDPTQIHDFKDMVNRLKKQHMIILSSHILSVVEDTSDRVLILRRGELIHDIVRHGDELAHFMLSMQGDAQDILRRLRSFPNVAKVKQIPSKVQGAPMFDVEVPDANAFPKQVHTLACAHNLPILHFARQENALEQLFISAMQEKN